MWTQFHNDGNVPTQYAAITASDRNSTVCLGILPTAMDLCKYQLVNKRCASKSLAAPEKSTIDQV